MKGKDIYLLAYDIQNGRILNKVAKRVMSCMNRIQYSVYIGRIDVDMSESLSKDISKLIGKNDKFLIIQLNEKNISESYFKGKSFLIDDLVSKTVII